MNHGVTRMRTKDFICMDCLNYEVVGLKSYKDTAETKLKGLTKQMKKADKLNRGENEFLKKDREKLQDELNRVKLEAEIAGEKCEAQLEMQKNARRAQLQNKEDEQDTKERLGVERLQLFEVFLEKL